MPHRFAFLLAVFLAVPAAAQVQGVGYRLAPAVSYVDFEGDAALTDGLLYGGGVGLSFGEFFELDGAYLLGRGFETDFSDFSGVEDDPALAAALAGLDPRDVDLERYGGGLRINLGRAGVVPFLTGGTGLIRFDPEGRDASRAIYLTGGAGLQLTGADRYALAVVGEVLSYRYNPGTTFFTPADLAAVGLGYDDFNQTTVVNPTLRGTVQLYLGGRRPGRDTEVDRELRRQFSGGLAGLSLVVEPFYGRVDFEDDTDYRDQAFAGVEAGVDLGPLVGLRGFYGRGVDEGDPTTTEAVQLYGGDVRLRLSEGGSFVPFLTVGGGYLDVLDDYGTEEAAEPGNALAEDRPFAVGGAGVELALSPRVRAVGEARALLLSTQDADDTSRPEDVTVNPYFRGGLSLALGGDRGDRVAVVRQSTLDAERARLEAEREAVRLEALDRIAALEAELAAARAAGDADAVEALTAERDAAIDTAVGADVTATEPATDPVVDGAPAVADVEEVEIDSTAAPASAVSDRFVTLPVPAQGELYVRYGPPGGVRIGDGYAEGVFYDDALPAADQAAVDAQVRAAGLDEAGIRSLIRETLRESLAAQGDDPLTEADVARIERSIEDRIADRIGGRLAPAAGASDGRIQALERRQDELIDEIRALRVELAREPAAPVVVQPTAPAGPVAPVTPVVDPDAVAVVPVLRERPTVRLSPAAGLGLGDGPDGVLAGLRVDYETGRAFRYVPELLIGAGSSIVANLDLAFPLRAATRPQTGTPYVRTGLGLVTYGGSDELPATFDEEPDEGGTALALNLGLGTDLAIGGGRLFVDLTTGNFGAFNRLTAGYRFPFGRQAE